MLGTQISPTKLVQHIIETIAAGISVDLICACIYREDFNKVEPIVCHSSDSELLGDLEKIYRLLGRYMKRSLTTIDPYILSTDELGKTPFQSALVFVLSMHDQVMGVLALFSRRPGAFTAHDIDLLVFPVSTIRMAIENLHLYEALAQNMVISQSILLTAQTIADNPSPQHIINVLRDYLFDTHVTSCAIMLYGPVREDRPDGPYDYLEMKGSWSKLRGSGIALTTKIYLKFYPELLRELDERKPLVINDVKRFIAGLDPFARAILRAERIRSLTILPLHAAERKLGVILVGTNKPHKFSQHELQNYQAVSEFLAISARSQVLQQQHDTVQQGRAALLDAVTDGVVMVLPDVEGGRVLTLNQRFTKIFGVPEAKAQGTLLRQLLKEMQIPEAVRRELSSRWLNVPVRDSLTQRGEFHMIHNEGVPMDIEWYAGPVYQESHVLGRIYTFHDVTAERTAVRVRSAFLSRVSHELRTPLTSIHGFAEFILEATGNQLPPLAREYTEIILNSAKHLRTVFADMIEMSRAEAGELKLNMREAHMPDLVIDAVARLELQYKARSQTVIMELDDELPSVHIDSDRIVQVLSNLMSNAIKYSPEASTIRVSTRLINSPYELPERIAAEVSAPGILVTVSDEGEGLSKEEIEQVFMPFFRTDWAKANKIEGTGLGLAVARGIIELHRGKIWSEPSTKENRGGHFMFIIPATYPSEPI
jgi:signal transduction histidine kinase